MKSGRAMEPQAGVAVSPGEQLDLDGRLCGDLTALEDFARELGARTRDGEQQRDVSGFLPGRINADRGAVDKDLAKLVLTLVELVRRLMERQAVRRVNAGSLTDDEVERMGETFFKLDRRMTELCIAFGLQRDELKLNLGPLGDLM